VSREAGIGKTASKAVFSLDLRFCQVKSGPRKLVTFRKTPKIPIFMGLAGQAESRKLAANRIFGRKRSMIERLPMPFAAKNNQHNQRPEPI
jgi:hypothetical protein